MKKTLFAIILALVLVTAFAVSALAADGISADEQKLLDKFKAGVTLDDSTVVTPPAAYITAAEQELTKTEFSAAQLAKLEKVMDDVFAAIKANNLHNAKEITAYAQYDSLVKSIQSVATELGYTVAPNDGNDPIIKRTGMDLTASVIVAVSVVIVLSASVAVVSKKKLLAE